MKIARAKFDDARVSFKQSMIICKEIKGKKLERAKKILQDLIEQKTSLDGKYYTSTVEKFLEIVKNAEANAKQKGLNIEKTFIKTARADAGKTFTRPKSRFKFRGRKAKSSSILIEVEER
jgi:large subunit ribosomal protein L22